MATFRPQRSQWSPGATQTITHWAPVRPAEQARTAHRGRKGTAGASTEARAAQDFQQRSQGSPGLPTKVPGATIPSQEACVHCRSSASDFVERVFDKASCCQSARRSSAQRLRDLTMSLESEGTTRVCVCVSYSAYVCIRI